MPFKWVCNCNNGYSYATDLSSAIRYYRRRGRKKADLDGKPSGGNEFIAKFIVTNTGVKRCRKQVSSHIQVLKGFLSENRRCQCVDRRDTTKC